VIAEAEAAGIELEVVVIREGDRYEGPAKRRVTVSLAIFRELSQTVTPQGLLAVGRINEVACREAIGAARRQG